MSTDEYYGMIKNMFYFLKEDGKFDDINELRSYINQTKDLFTDILSFCAKDKYDALDEKLKNISISMIEKFNTLDQLNKDNEIYKALHNEFLTEYDKIVKNTQILQTKTDELNQATAIAAAAEQAAAEAAKEAAKAAEAAEAAKAADPTAAVEAAKEAAEAAAKAVATTTVATTTVAATAVAAKAAAAAKAKAAAVAAANPTDAANAATDAAKAATDAAKEATDAAEAAAEAAAAADPAVAAEAAKEAAEAAKEAVEAAKAAAAAAAAATAAAAAATAAATATAASAAAATATATAAAAAAEAEKAAKTIAEAAKITAEAAKTTAEAAKIAAEAAVSTTNGEKENKTREFNTARKEQEEATTAFITEANNLKKLCKTKLEEIKISTPDALQLTWVMTIFYLIDFLEFKKFVKTQKSGTDIKAKDVSSSDFTDIKNDFKNYLEKYEFHSKGGLKALLYFALTNRNGTLIDNRDKIMNQLMEKKQQKKEPKEYVYVELIQKHLEEYLKNYKSALTDIDSLYKTIDSLDKTIDNFVNTKYITEYNIADLKKTSDIYIVANNMIKTAMPVIAPSTGIVSLEDAMKTVEQSTSMPIRTKELTKYFIGFLRYKKYTIKDTKIMDNNGKDVTDVANVFFQDYLAHYEFHSKDELAGLTYYAITDDSGVVSPDFQLIIDNIKKEGKSTKEIAENAKTNAIAIIDKLKRQVEALEKAAKELQNDSPSGASYKTNADNAAAAAANAHNKDTSVAYNADKINSKTLYTKNITENITDTNDNLTNTINKIKLDTNPNNIIAQLQEVSKNAATISTNPATDKVREDAFRLKKQADEVIGIAETAVNAIELSITANNAILRQTQVEGFEKTIYVDKFVEVLKQFDSYVKKNNVVFTNKNGENTTLLIKSFLDNLYPNYGPYQNITDVTFYSAQSKAPTQDDIAESALYSFSPERADLIMEIEKDPFAYYNAKKQMRMIDAKHEVKRRKLKEIVKDVATLAMLIPEKASRDYAVLNYANSAVNPYLMKIVEKLTPEQKREKEIEKNRMEKEADQTTKIEQLERDRELATAQRATKEAQKAFENVEKPMEAKATVAGGGSSSEEDDMDEEERYRRRQERKQEEREERSEEYQEAEEEPKEVPKEEEEEPEEKKADEKREQAQAQNGKEEVNEDIKRIQEYKKAKDDLARIKDEILAMEDTVVNFKPVVDKYTVESPLVALDDANKQYQDTKIEIARIKKEKETKQNEFLRRKDADFNKPYKEYAKLLDAEVALKEILQIISANPKEIDTITNSRFLNKIKQIESLDNTADNTLFPIFKVFPGLKTNTTGIPTLTKINSALTRTNSIKGTGEDDKDFEDKKNAIKTTIENIQPEKERKITAIANEFNGTKAIYGVNDTNIAEFRDELKKRFDENFGSSSSNSKEKINDDIFKLYIIQAIPSYKELKEQEKNISYKIEEEKNRASSLTGQLKSVIDPVEVEDKTRILKEAKEKTKEGLTRIKEIIELTHVPRFKNNWKDKLKEVTEGAGSIENLLQKMIDRTTVSMKDVQTRLSSIHGIAQAEIPKIESESTGYLESDSIDRTRERDYRDIYRGHGGLFKTKELSDPQKIYSTLLEQIIKLKEILDELLSFIERNTNSTALLSANGDDSIFVQLYNKYIEDRADPKKSSLEATETLVQTARNNKLIPSEVLKIDKYDKTVFIFLTLFLRLFALSIMEYLIDKKKITTLQWALGVYLIAYTGLFLIFVVLVNLDMYRMRIIFNYINLHAGAGAIIGHIVMIWLFALLIFVILRNIQYLKTPSGVNQDQAVTAEDRAQIKNRMSMISGIIWLFTTIIVAIS